MTSTLDYIAQYLADCGMKLVTYQPHTINAQYNAPRSFSIENSLWFLDTLGDDRITQEFLANFELSEFTGGQLFIRSSMDTFQRYYQTLPSLTAQPLDYKEPSLYVFQNFVTIANTVQTNTYSSGVPNIRIPFIEVLFESCFDEEPMPAKRLKMNVTRALQKRNNLPTASAATR